MAPADYEWPCARRATAWVARPCARRWPAGAYAVQPKAYTPRTTDSTRGLRCAPNRLLDQPTPTQGNRVWVSDITYLPLADDRWAHLAAFQDVVSKLVVEWHVGTAMPEKLVTNNLFNQLP